MIPGFLLAESVKTRVHPFLVAWLAILGVAFVPMPASHAEEGTIPGWDEYVRPLSDGTRTGHVALPVVRDGQGLAEVLDPDGYELHLTHADAPGGERVFPAGRPFSFPRGRWRLWLQGEWSMTPYSTLVSFPGRDLADGRVSTIFLPVVPAGRVRASAGAFEAAHELWLLYLGSRPEGMDYELSRRRPLSEVGAGLLMPAADVLAAVWDPHRERYLAVGGPFQVPAGSSMEVPLQAPPPGVAQLFVHLVEPDAFAADTHADVALVLSRGDRQHPPDLTFATAWGLYAVWYSLPPGPAILSGGNDGLYLPPATLDLGGGEVASFDGPLERRPILDVSLALEARLREKPFSLEARQLPDERLLSKVELPRTAGQHRFDGLVRDLVEVSLVTHLGTYRETIDLRGREEATLLLDPNLLDFHGSVRLGGEAHPARLRFVTTRDEVEVVTDEEGRYKTTLMAPLRLAAVDLEDVRQAPWMEVFMPGLDEGGQLDFDISDAEVSVRIVDAATGRPVPGDRIAVRSVYREEGAAQGDPPLEDRTSSGDERVFAQSYESDDEGVVWLPPPRRGRIEVGASAEGYRSSPEDLVVIIDDPAVDRELELRLEPFGELREIQLLLPDGSPAAGARVWRLASLDTPRVIDSSTADPAGRVRIPVEPGGGFLILKPNRPDAAFAIEEWDPWKERRGAVWSFPPAAEPLRLRILDPSGTELAPRTQVALWVGGHKLSGWLLRLLLDVPPLSDAAGYLTVVGLPRGPLSVLGWERSAREQEESGVLDSLATPVSYPWPQVVEVKAVR